MPSILTDVAARNAKSGVAAYKLSDAHGLYLLVSKADGKLWRFDYRFNNVRRTLSIGPYPLISLSEAREARDDARKLLRKRVDPIEQKRREQVETELRRSVTFALIADEVIAKMERERRAEATLKAGATRSESRRLENTQAAETPVSIALQGRDELYHGDCELRDLVEHP